MEILDYKYVFNEQNSALFNTKTGHIFRVYDPKLKSQLMKAFTTNEIENELLETLKSNQNKPLVTKSKPCICNNHSRFELGKLTLVLTSQCNLRCKYCYANYGNYEYKEKQNMTKQQIDEIINYFVKGVNKIHSVMFFGGEPTLESEKIIYTIEKFKYLKEKGEIDYIPAFGLITNGVYFTDELARTLSQFEAGVTLSVDGNEFIHDKLRPNIKGEGSFNHILRTYSLLQKYNIPVEIETTYTNLHLEEGGSFVELVQFFKEKFNCLIPHVVLVNTDENNNLNPSLNKERLFLYLEEVVDYTFDNLMENGKLNTISLVARMLRNLAFTNNYDKICPAGVNTISIGADQKIQPCFMYTSKEDMCLGTLEDTPQKVLDNMIEFDRKNNYKSNIDVCKTCYINRVCSSCLGSFTIENTGVYAKSDLTCEFLKKIAELILLRLVEIKSDPKKWELFQQRLG